MNTKPVASPFRRTLQWIGLSGILIFGLLSGSQPVAHAQGEWLENSRVAAAPGASPVTNAEDTANAPAPEDGLIPVATIINGPPTPPPGYEMERAPVELPTPNGMKTSNSLTVPAYDWVFGCSSVSGAMIAGYYDRNGYPNMYTGPANGGVAPLDNSTTYWPTWSDGFVTYPNLPLAASKNGVDGRATKGSIDDYWIQYNSSAPDPYIGNWTQHTWGDAIGDYMKTSQSAYSNPDGTTNFYNFNGPPPSAAQLTCASMPGYGIDQLDGTYGRKLFYEARGYTVTTCYNQLTDNRVTGGFSFAQFKAEIDAGRPVMLNLYTSPNGHTIVGVGYNDSGNTIYIHDTWDYNNHSMTWGGSYSGMALHSVSIVNIASCNTPTMPSLSAPSNGATTNNNAPNFDWSDSTNANVYDFLLDDNSDFSSPIVNNTNVTVSAYTSTPTLSDGTYYWQVRGHNTSGGCNVYGSWTSSWSFTVDTTPPSVPNLLSPNDSATINNNTPTFDWDDSTGSPTTYQLLVDDNSDFSSPEINASPSASTYTPSSSLADAQYWWKVRASDAVGNWSNYSATRSFTVSTVACNTPSTPSLSAPSNGATANDDTPNFDWSDSTNANVYDFILDNNSDFSSPVVNDTNVTSSSYSSTPTLSDDTYYWQVRGHNTSGICNVYGSWTSVWSFTVDTTPPSIPSLLAPDDSATISNNTPTFDWSDSTGSPSAYQLLVDDNSDFSSPVIDTSPSASTYTPASSLADAQYWWKVRASDAAGNWSNYSSTRSFTVDTTPPSVPNLLSPDDSATTSDNTPTFDWDDSTGSPTAYQLLVDDNSDFSSPVIDVSPSTSTYTLAGPLAEAQYWWKVRARDAVGNWSGYSGTRNFQIVLPPLTLLTPANGVNARTRSPFFDWTDHPDALSYALQVTTDPAFVKKIKTYAAIADSSYLPAKDLRPNTWYYWRVAAITAGGTIYSDIHSFTTGNPPSIPKLKTPKKNGLVLDLRPFFDWLDSKAPKGTTFDHYQIQVSTDPNFASFVIGDDNNVNVTASDYIATVDLTPATTYYWRVRAFNTDGDYSRWSKAYNFREAFAAPSLTAPIGPIAAPRPTFNWDAISGATAYKIQVSTDAAYKTKAVYATVYAASYAPIKDLLPGTIYHWRVQALGPYGPGNWGAQSFTTL